MKKFLFLLKQDWKSKKTENMNPISFLQVHGGDYRLKNGGKTAP